MNKQELIRKIEEMIYDKNYYINSKKGTSLQIACWDYARQNLKNVLNYVKLLDEK